MSGRRAAGVTISAALAHLQREADLDGLVTISNTELGAALGMTHTAAWKCIEALVAEGLIEHRGRTSGIKGHSISAYQLSDEAMA